MGTKSLYMSVAAVSEPHHDCRVTPGTPPLPSFPPYTTFLVSGSSCELMSWPLNANGNVAPTINIQGSNTTLTGPLGDDASFSYASDKDTDGTMYVLGVWTIAHSPFDTFQYFISAFSAGSSGNIAPARRIVINNAQVLAAIDELPWGGLCVDGHGNVYVGLGHFIFKFATTASGTVTGDVFVTSTGGDTYINDQGITSLYFDVVRQVIWATYFQSQNYTGPVIVGYNLDGSIYSTVTYSGINQPMQIAVGPDGSLYIADQAAGPRNTGAVFVLTPPTLAISATLYESANNWNFTYLGVGVDLSGKIYVSVGNTGAPGGVGRLFSYPKGSNGDVAGTQLTEITGAATFLSNMISGAVTFPAQIRLIT